MDYSLARTSLSVCSLDYSVVGSGQLFPVLGLQLSQDPVGILTLWIMDQLAPGPTCLHWTVTCWPC